MPRPYSRAVRHICTNRKYGTRNTASVTVPSPFSSAQTVTGRRQEATCPKPYFVGRIRVFMDSIMGCCASYLNPQVWNCYMIGQQKLSVWPNLVICTLVRLLFVSVLYWDFRQKMLQRCEFGLFVCLFQCLIGLPGHSVVQLIKTLSKYRITIRLHRRGAVLAVWPTV